MPSVQANQAANTGILEFDDINLSRTISTFNDPRKKKLLKGTVGKQENFF